MHFSLARRVCGSLLLAVVTGCSTVEAVNQPASYIAGKQPRTVWLTKSNRSVVRVDGPRMLGDTVIGSVGGEYTEIPLSEVTRVAAMQTSQGKTIAAATLGGAVTVAALVVIFRHSGSSSNTVTQQIADTMTLGRQF
jgi:hypothetical protein